ncbi:MAG: MBL fold metallo-hydrolase [Actinomycetia bacterium]|nr:MBL fold metallo-hydrolase [Actinomycetes bacterium]
MPDEQGRVDVARSETAVTVEVLTAGPGDCILVECHRRIGPPWRLLIDGGLPEFWPQLRRRLAAIDDDRRRIDVLVVSHVDSDHIGGLLPLLSGEWTDLALDIGDVWFNGPPLLPSAAEARRRSLAQGQALVEVLTGVGAGAGLALPWNVAFAGCAVSTGPDAGLRTVEVGAGGPVITLLSPTDRRLRALERSWFRYLDRLKRGEPSQDPEPRQPPVPLDDLDALAATAVPADRSIPNGSSIAFLLEHRGVRCLFAADAHVSVLGAALYALTDRRGGPIELDLFKLPHHGSQGNVSLALLELAPAHHYVVSTTGERFEHPDDVALARVATTSLPGSMLWFNHDSAPNRRWSSPRLQNRWRFGTGFAPADGPGLRFELEAR